MPPASRRRNANDFPPHQRDDETAKAKDASKHTTDCSTCYNKKNGFLEFSNSEENETARFSGNHMLEQVKLKGWK